MEPIVEITPEAIKEIKHILNEKNIPSEYGLRLTIKGGSGCGGMNHAVGFDKKTFQDITYTVEGVEIMIKKTEMLYLVNKKLAFYEGSEARGFLFLDQLPEESSTEAR
jgi:iron-sulfur cluster assembly protein